MTDERWRRWPEAVGRGSRQGRRKDWRRPPKANSYHLPNALAALAYDATNILIQAIKDAGADDTAKVKDAMAKISFNAVSGKTTFDSNHNPVKPVTILRVSQGVVRFAYHFNPLE